MDIYICRKGDTLPSLSRRFGIGEDKLMNANGLEIESVTAGLSLLIPNNNSTPESETELCGELKADLPPLRRKKLLEKFCFAVPYSIRLSHEGGITMEESPQNFAQEALNYEAVPLLGVYNLCSRGAYSGELAHFALKDEDSRETLCKLLMSAVKESGAKGIYLEFCCLFPFDCDNYCRFLEKCSALCHENGFYFICTAVPPEFSQLSEKAVECAGKCADRVVLLSYDYSGISSPPGAVSPISRVRKSIESVSKSVPAKKLIICLSGMGFDWSIPWHYGFNASPISSVRAQNLAAAIGAEIKFMPKELFPTFSYSDLAGIKHRVCYEDARSISAKIRLCGEYGLAGLWLKRWDREFLPAENIIDSVYSYKKYV